MNLAAGLQEGLVLITALLVPSVIDYRSPEALRAGLEVDVREKQRDVKTDVYVHLRNNFLTAAHEWNNISMRRINGLVNSMHRMIRAVTQARGGHTRY